MSIKGMLIGKTPSSKLSFRQSVFPISIYAKIRIDQKADKDFQGFQIHIFYLEFF